MNDFIFKFVFESEKDKPWSNSNVFRNYIKKKYNINNQSDGTKLYIAINKYQVKKYGGSMQPHNILCREDYLRRAEVIRKEKYRRTR